MHVGTPTYLLLGPVRVTGGAGGTVEIGGAQRRAVLAQLALAVGHVVTTDLLSQGLWGDRPPPTATKSIQVHISRLRQALPSGHLVSSPPGYVLAVARETCDVGCFESMVEDARRDASAGRWESASDLLGTALGLWRGPALADVAHLPFATGAVARLEEARQQAVEAKVAADLALGRHAALVPDLESMVFANPLRETLWAHLMTALYRCDRQADALQAFSRARRHLVEELGLEPGPELRRLEQAILIQAVPPLEVRPAVQPERRPTIPSTPSSLREPGPIVGRDEPLARLRAAIDEVAATGSVGAVAVRGDEGLGKTSLVAAFANAVADRAPVLSGRCREHVAVPFGPWSQILRGLDARQELELLEGTAALQDELPERRRALLFDGVASRLAEAGRRSPTLVVLDDLHWSDEASISLLLHCLDELAQSPVLFVLAWRDREVGAGHPVARLGHRLARTGGMILDLAPLDRDDIAELLGVAAGGANPRRRADVASLIHGVTSGVPLFVAELVATVAVTFDELPDAADLATGIPETVRTLVAHRLSGASAATTAVVEACAVLSEPFTAATVHALLPTLETAEVLLALDELADLGLIHEGPVGYAFEHDAFRRAVDAGIRSGRRQVLHAAAYRALEDEPVPPVLLVHHAAAAGDLVGAPDLLRHLLRAGADAVARGAFVDAAELFGRAVERADGPTRPEVMIAHADALWRAGDITSAKAVAGGVIALASGGAVVDRVLADAVVLHSTFGDGYGLDRTSIAAAETALRVVTDPQQSARVRVALAYHLAMWGAPVGVALEAVDKANRSLPEQCPVGVAVEAKFAESVALLGTPKLERRRQLVRELLDLACDTGSVRDLGRALRARSLVEMSTGRLDDLGNTLLELGTVADRSGSWLYRADACRWRIALDLAAGDSERAAAGVDELERICASPLAGRAVVGSQRLLLHWARGEQAPCLALLDGLLASLPADPERAPDRRLAELFRLVLLVEIGQVGEAREALLQWSPQNDLDRAPCRRYPAELALTAGLTAHFELVDQADPLIQRLEPFRGQLLVLSWGESILGAADRYLAQLTSLVDGRVDAASFQQAVDLELAAGAVGEAARTRAVWQRCADKVPSSPRR